MLIKFYLVPKQKLNGVKHKSQAVGFDCTAARSSVAEDRMCFTLLHFLPAICLLLYQSGIRYNPLNNRKGYFSFISRVTRRSRRKSEESNSF